MYDRQIRTIGLNSTIKINNSIIAIYGLKKGLGTEILKNIVLCGIKTIYLIDNNIITSEDLITGYYYSTDDIGSYCHNILKKQLEKLNPNITIICVNSIYDIDYTDIIICINKDKDELIEINNFYKLSETKFISLHSSNNKGIIFVDAGNNHLVTNITGEVYEPVQILSLDNTGLITTNGHEFQTGDTILLTNLQGENINNLNMQYTIEVINKYKFKLNNLEYNNFVFINGTAEYIDKPIYINHNSYEHELSNIDTVQIEDIDLIKNYIHSDIEIITVNSIMGSIVASEIIKLISNKYLPINQWFVWHDNNLNIQLITDKIINTEFLIVGAGAIGCELLKNLAFLNVKKILITDYDIIEKSNLSRQFLFHENTIGEHKSKIASYMIKQMKPNLEINYFYEKVGDDNQNFIDNILQNKNLTGVFNALDNITARKYMDLQCFNNNIPLFESGTMGLKGNTQPIIPFITETYSNTNDPINDKSFPVCTIKHFPNEIYHTIYWAMDNFEFFKNGPLNFNKWIENKSIINNEILYDVWLFTTKYNIIDCLSCVYWAINMFNEFFNIEIIKLLNKYPKDLVNIDNTLFWSGGKRCPIPIFININNDQHIEFILITTLLLCNCVNIICIYNKEDIINILNEYKLINEPINTIMNENINDNTKIKCAIPQIFNKDIEYHIKWIMLASNIRALNYSIIPVDLYTTKGIISKIIPAIATTTALVSGLISNEMIKYLCYNTIDKFKSTFINLAVNTFISVTPRDPPELEIGELKFNSWEKFIEKDNLTIQEFIIKYNKIFNINITIISINNAIIYADFIPDNINKLLYDVIYELFNNIQNTYILTITSTNNIILPNIILKSV